MNEVIVPEAIDNQLTPAVECELTNEQKAACEQIIAEIRTLTKQVIYDYWKMGRQLNRVFSDMEKNDGNLYGRQAVRYISQQTGHSVTDLYRMNSVYVSFTEEQIQSLASLNVSLSNVIAATKIPDEQLRLECLRKSADDHMTVREFKTYVDEVLEEHVDDTTSTKVKDKASGIKSRPGTGRKASSLTPLNRVVSFGEKLHDELTDAVEALHAAHSGELDHPKFSGAALQAAGVAAQLLSQLSGFLQSFESQFPELGSADDREARRSVYQSTINALQDILNQESTHASSQEASDPQPARRRRGRRAAARAAAVSADADDHGEPVPADDADAAEDLESDQQDVQEQPRRRRGRPRKQPAAEGAAASSPSPARRDTSAEADEQRKAKEAQALNKLEEIRKRLIGSKGA